MKQLIFSTLLLFLIIASSSCRNKTVELLTKKWDCVQVENIIPPGTKLLSAKDSADAEQLRILLTSLSWTFKKNMKYECTVSNRITSEGRYELIEGDKIMICTDENNNTRRYIIKTISENDLVLSGNAENTNIIMHFRPH